MPYWAYVTNALNKKLCKFQTLPFDGWRDNEITALEKEMEKLVKPPLLGVPGLQIDYTVDMDTHDKDIGYVSVQEQTDGTD